MLDARDFGVKTAGEFYDVYVSQGMWTRCLECKRRAGLDTSRPTRTSAAGNAVSEGASQDGAPRDSSKCTRCDERGGWSQDLTFNSHGCSACKNAFSASTWNAQIIRNH